jgi:hypothetical protein
VNCGGAFTALALLVTEWNIVFDKYHSTIGLSGTLAATLQDRECGTGHDDEGHDKTRYEFHDLERAY